MATSTSTNQMQASDHSLSTSHDVFLSFRNVDADKIFADHLCQALNLDGIRTLFYDSELRGGGEKPLVRTIEMSKIIVVVLSEIYASSRYCLDELVEILRSKQQIVPIFYHVHPAALRHQTGEFGTAFRKEKNKKNNRKKAQSWRAALSEIGNHRGYVLADSERGFEFELKHIPGIVKKVKNGIRNSGHLNKSTAPHPVSLKSGTQNLEEAYNNQPFPIDTLRTSSQANELELKRIQEIVKKVKLGMSNSVLLGTATQKSSTQNLEEAFNKPPFPIDTLWTASQTDESEAQLNFLGEEVTLFDMKELSGLLEKASHYKLLQSKFVAVRNLKVMHISNSKISDIPDNLSFPDLQKLILQPNLDWSCIPFSFFEKMPALKVLDMSNTSINTLPTSVCKLIKLEELLLRRCDNMRKLTHDIGALENLKVLDLSGCTNLAELPEYIDLLQKLSSLVLTNCKSLTNVPQHLCLLRSLQNLNLSGCTNLVEIPETIEFLQRLSSLFLSDCNSLTRLPQSLCMLRSLRNLSLSGCTNLAEILGYIEFLDRLSILVITDCKSLRRLPQSIFMLRSLQNLHLFGCTNLVEIPESIEFLEGLSSLTLTDCKSLTKLPHSLCMLRSLQNLNLSGCTYLAEIPQSIEFLEGLTSLILTDCKSLTNLPHSLCMLRSLQILNLSGCTNLADIPESIELLQGLSSLVLTDCKSLTRLPYNINMLRSLRNLSISGCTNLAYTPYY
ncbi:hypothetical protein POM88_023492 [Heracleum sosnowskyi]|uniref:TIR domain-containing protein n=1 Tax=Heracleum sosnowskyi TaxID=360622 RepID=A0AAD8MV05_9APIA|nr:hypothetical protein POM88_023492 [Heracleum sosnowskyi]